MTSRSRDELMPIVTPPKLSRQNVEELLSLRLIAKLATLDDDGGVHLVPMWFSYDGHHVCMPTSSLTRKYRNLSQRPRCSVMVDVSRSGLDLRGALIRGTADLIEGDEARRINRSIHLRYITEPAMEEEAVKAYLTEGDDVTIRLPLEKVVTWNHADSPAGRAVAMHAAFRPLDS